MPTANRYLKTWSPSPATREMQTKTTRRHHLTPATLLKELFKGSDCSVLSRLKKQTRTHWKHTQRFQRIKRRSNSNSNECAPTSLVWNDRCTVPRLKKLLCPSSTRSDRGRPSARRVPAGCPAWQSRKPCRNADFFAFSIFRFLHF